MSLPHPRQPGNKLDANPRPRQLTVMKDTHFKTATQPFNRLAETGLQRLTLSTTHSRSAWGWALGLFLLCCGSMTGAWAQALSNPNGIDGIIEWNNNPSSAVYAHLTTAGNGLAVGTMYHNDLSFSLPGHTPITMITSPMSAKYEVQVQAGTSVGIQHNLSPQMFTAVWTYWFDTKLSAGVVNPPVAPKLASPKSRRTTCPSFAIITFDGFTSR